MIPASNMKLVSTAAALHYLGPDYVFRTHIALLGDSLVVIRGGDRCWAIPLLINGTAVNRGGCVRRLLAY